MPPSAIRSYVTASESTLYQTLRRMHQRGEIRRASRGGVGGWEINPAGSPEQVAQGITPDYANQEPTPSKEKATGVVWGAMSRLSAQEVYPTPVELVDQLIESRMHDSRPDLEWAIWSMTRSGILRSREDGSLDMPEEVRG